MEEISLDILMIRDQEYFKKHPDQTSYIRECIRGEFAEGFDPPYVLVTKIYEGIRIRQPIWELPK